jgi:Cu+-exporting ATPase
MIRSISILALAACIGLLFAASASAKEKAKNADTGSLPAADLASIPAGYKQAYFKIGGMCCANCAKGVETALAPLNGMDSLKTDVATGILVAVYDPGKLKDAMIESEIARAGYTNEGRGAGGVWSRVKNSDGSVKLALEVRGMSDSASDDKIETGIAKLAGVKTVHANHEAKAVVVEYDPKQAKESEIVAAIDKLGYEVTSDNEPANTTQATASISLLLV